MWLLWQYARYTKLEIPVVLPNKQATTQQAIEKIKTSRITIPHWQKKKGDYLKNPQYSYEYPANDYSNLPQKSKGDRAI